MIGVSCVGRYLRKESRKLKKFTLRWCAFIDAEHVGVTVSPVQVGIGMGLVSNPRQLGWLLVYVDAEAQTAQVRSDASALLPLLVFWLMRGTGVTWCVCVQECVPFVSQACKVGYPKRHRPAHPYCFRFEGTKGAFAGTKYILAADVDAVRVFAAFSLAPLLFRCRTTTVPYGLSPIFPTERQINPESIHITN